MTEAFIGLGSNLGDRLAHLRAALNLIAAEQAFLPRAASRVWESRALEKPAILQLGNRKFARLVIDQDS